MRDFRLRISAGISTYPFDGATPSALLRAADQALYSAKASGKDRDRVVSGRRSGRADDGRRPRAEQQAATPRDAAEERDRFSRTSWRLPRRSRRSRRSTGICSRLCKSLVFVVGATACSASRVVGRLPRGRDGACAARGLARRCCCVPHLRLPADGGNAPYEPAARGVVPRRRRGSGRGVHPPRAGDERAADASSPRRRASLGPGGALRDAASAVHGGRRGDRAVPHGAGRAPARSCGGGRAVRPTSRPSTSFRRPTPEAW